MTKEINYQQIFSTKLFTHQAISITSYIKSELSLLLLPLLLLLLSFWLHPEIWVIWRPGVGLAGTACRKSGTSREIWDGW